MSPPRPSRRSLPSIAPSPSLRIWVERTGSIVRRILADARRYLSDEGILVVEVGQAREALETAYPGLPFFWLDTEESEGEVFALGVQDLASI